MKDFFLAERKSEHFLLKAEADNEMVPGFDALNVQAHMWFESSEV